MFITWYPSNFIDSHFVQARMLGEENNFLLGLLIFLFPLLFMFLSYGCRVTLFVFKLLHHKSEETDRVWSWIVVCGWGPGLVCQNFVFDTSITILIATGWQNVNVLNLQRDSGFILNTPVPLAHHCSHHLVIRIRGAHCILNIMSLNRHVSAVPIRMGFQTSAVNSRETV